MSKQRLPAEWEPQDAILLVWPRAQSLWSDNIEEITQLYESLVTVICDFADVLLVVTKDEEDNVRSRLEQLGATMEYIHFCCVPTNDTWVRDTGPLIVEMETGFKLLDFDFNGWGNKFPHELDNQLTRELCRQGFFDNLNCEAQGWVLEGGSIETDGEGTLLTTSSCLLNPNRNPQLSKSAIEEKLKAAFGVSKINWLDSGFLMGDDTDGHIDTLARLCPDNTIVYTACDDPEDEHYASLKSMEVELQQMTNAQGESYRLLPLPWAGKIYHRDVSAGDEQKRVPATYANFLIVNSAVLVPIYELPSDEDALEVIANALPGYEILGIPCIALIERGGSLHCVTIQIPRGQIP
jgi:agmatine deiminase